MRHCGFGAAWAAMATAMATGGGAIRFATAPGSARGPHTARQKKGSARGKGGQRPGAAAVLAGVLLQGAEKEWLQKMADTPLDKIQQIRDEARENVRRNAARTAARAPEASLRHNRPLLCNAAKPT